MSHCISLNIKKFILKNVPTARGVKLYSNLLKIGGGEEEEGQCIMVKCPKFALLRTPLCRGKICNIILTYFGSCLILYGT